MKGVKRLAYEFEPENYRLELKPDHDNMTFEGRVVITGRKLGRPTHRLTFHQNGLKIKTAKITLFDKKKGSLSVEVSRINILKSAHELRIHTTEVIYPGKYEVEITFSGHINKQMHGMYACSYNLAGKPAQLIATQLESHYAREVFPCIDEPAAKATFDLTLETPIGETVLSNMPVKKQLEDKNLITTSFATSPKMSTYLLAFAYGNLKYKETISSSGVKVRSYATPANYKLLDFSLDVARRAIDFFENYFDTKYPLPKLDMIALPDFSAGAMENWGLITYRESCMLIDPDSSVIESKQFAALIICHEIAHQWFGNLVTMEWWDDLWLNESFANIMEYRVVDELFPEWDIWEHFVNNEVSSALRRDCLPNVQPVRLEVHHPDEISTLFDPSIVYAKGSSLVRMLMHKVGEDKFKIGLKKYFKKHAYANTKGSDLWSALGEASGQDLSNFMNHWISTPGFPVVSIDYAPGADSAELTQNRMLIGESSSQSRLWPIPLSPSQPIDLDVFIKRSQTIRVESGSGSTLMLNDGCRSYFVTRYVNPAHFKAILSNVSGNTVSIINRVTLLQNYTLLERACQVSTTDNLELLMSFASERDESVWATMAGVIGTTRRLVFDTEGEQPMKKYVAFLVLPLIKEVGWERGVSETTQTQRLRELILTLGTLAEIPEVIQEGLNRFRSFNKPTDLTPDIRSAVYYTGARYGETADFQKILSLYKTIDSAEEKETLSSALSSTKDQKNIAQLINMLTTSQVRLQDMATWFAYLMNNPYSKDETWSWMVEKWQWLEKKYGEDRTQDRFPRYAASAFSNSDELEKYKAFFDPKTTNKAFRRVIQLGIEEISGRVDWRTKNQTNTIDWLKAKNDSLNF